MKMKKIVLVSCVGAALIGLGFGLSNAMADEEYVSIPNPDVKAEIINVLEGNELIGEDVLSNLRNFHYVSKGALQEIADYGYLSIQSKNYENPENTSLEGLQGLAIETLNIDTPLIDITPLSKVSGVRSLSLTDQYNNLGYTHGIRNLDVLKGWTALEEFNFCNGSMNGVEDLKEKEPLLDISALSNIETLRYICVETAGSLDPIYLTAEDNNYETTLPIVLSTHFNSVDSWYVDSENPSYIRKEYEGDEQQKMSDKLRWENIEEGTEYLDVWVQIQPRGQYYIADLRIPIIWE
ncbi:hypothetical protein [uncultured Enterococcus sp.]|uniref:hypothetical protein n=1 Tax=uncultured Enterococcus sp. TaxID=167972 RepID=UPI002AA77AD8|nr:hypothetical protein [uncultured Enterococcus sp.]